MPSYKLTYYDAKARGENARMLFVLKGQAFEDVRLSFQDWPAVKPTTPFGSIPVLEVNGKKYCQARAIERYLANKFGLYGKTDGDKFLADMVNDCIGDVFLTVGSLFFVPAEQKVSLLCSCRAKGLYGKTDGDKFLADMVNDCIGDVFLTVGSLFFVPAEQKDEAVKKYFEEKGPLIQNLEKILTDHKYPVRKPDKVMWSDVVIHNFLEMGKLYGADHMVEQKDDIPTLIKIHDAVAANKKIKKWVNGSAKK